MVKVMISSINYKHFEKWNSPPEKTKGLAHDTGQIEQVVEKNILPATVNNSGEKTNFQRLHSSFALERYPAYDKIQLSSIEYVKNSYLC